MDPRDRKEIADALMATKGGGMERPASPFVSASKQCHTCKGGGPLKPYRSPWMATEHPTPVFCAKCMPRLMCTDAKRRADKEHTRQHREFLQSNPDVWMRNCMEFVWPVERTGVEDLVRKKPLPEPVGRVPSFVWEIPAGGADVLKTIRRGMRFQHGEGWLEGGFDAEKSSRSGRHHW
jgi:hypothetical protein